MSFNLHKRGLLALVEYAPRELRYMPDLAADFGRLRPTSATSQLGLEALLAGLGGTQIAMLPD